MSLKPFQPLLPHGKFNSKLVPGKNGKMRIHETENRPIESMISKIYPAKEAEEILSMRADGVKEFDADGNPQYGLGLLAGIGAAAYGLYKMGKGAQKRGHSPLNITKYSLGDWSSVDKISKKMEWGKYSPEAQKKKQLGQMMPEQMESIISQSKEMTGEGGYFDQQLEQEMEGFDIQGAQITAGGQQARNQAVQASNQVATQVGQAGFAGSGAADNLKQQMLTQSYGAGQQRQFGREGVDLGRQKAITADDLKRVKYEGDTQAALASMITSYMSATGEDVPQEMMTLFEEYNDYG